MSTPSSPPRYLSIWLRRLPTDRLARRASAPDESAPVIVVHMVKSALRIAAMNDAAARLRLTLGTALADARARHPALQVAQSDPAADWRLLQAVADWCDRYTPLVGMDAPSGVMLDVTGCSHLFGGETALCRDIVARLAAQGLRARVAVASTPGCAWAVARYGQVQNFPTPLAGKGSEDQRSEPGPSRNALIACPHPSRSARLPPPQAGEGWGGGPRRNPLPASGERDERVFIVPPGAMRDALAPLPLAALRLDPETVGALADVGLDRIADVLDLPRSVLAARFDAAFLRRLDQALGRADEPITPRRPAPSFMAEQHFAEPIARERDVLGTIARLSIRLGYAMETRGEGARLLEAALFRTDGKVHRIAVGTGAPLREAERMTRLFRDRLATLGEACDPGFGYDLVRLSAPVTERCDPVQAGLARHAAADEAAELGHLIDRLGARFGLRRVTRLAPQDTHIPEFAVAAVPAHAASAQAVASSSRVNRGRMKVADGIGRGAGSPSPRLRGEGRGEGLFNTDAPSPGFRARAESDLSPPAGRGAGSAYARPPSSTKRDGAMSQDTLAPARPARLFARAERIEAIAEAPDGPPVRFRWRRLLHEVAAAEGPERIALEWWRDEDGRALTRDYFRVETRAGARVWLYREGLYNRETAQPRWFLHGLFG